MQTLFQKMRANRGRWVKPPIQAAEPAPQVPFMVVDGERYVEAPEVNGCKDCAFTFNGCDEGFEAGRVAFGDYCTERTVIYIKAE